MVILGDQLLLLYSTVQINVVVVAVIGSFRACACKFSWTGDSLHSRLGSASIWGAGEERMVQGLN